MASRMIHYTIAKLLTDKIHFNNANKFLVGSLAPDMACYETDSHAKGIHKRVHFYGEFPDHGTRGENWLAFYNKYLKDNENDDFALGYFVHLICDTIWLTDIQAKYIYTIKHENRRDAITDSYNDMLNCNYHIAKTYDICFDIQPLQVFTVDEANMLYQEKILDDLKHDFLPCGDNLHLKIHNWDSIIEYIEKCVEISLKEVHLVQNGLEPDSPIPYMTPMDLK